MQTDFRGTVCSFGPRFRDLSQLTDQWYRFTPLDLRTDGVQTFDLIADDAYVIGQATVTVADGTVTIECSYVSADVHVREEFCTLLPSLAETATLDPRELVHYAFGEPIGIADALNGDTQVLLMICNVVDYNADMPIMPFDPDASACTARMDALMQAMD